MTLLDTDGTSRFAKLGAGKEDLVYEKLLDIGNDPKLTQSVASNENTRPGHDKPNASTVAPSCTRDFESGDGSKWVESGTSDEMLV